MEKRGGAGAAAAKRRRVLPRSRGRVERRRSGVSALGSSDDDDDDDDDDGDQTGGQHIQQSSPLVCVEVGTVRLRRRETPLIDAPLIWAQCDVCMKWRSLPLCRSESELPATW
jgi:hypothetical protein